MHAAIADKREELSELCQQYDVARLEVFGSAVRGTDFDPEKSDADLLAEFDPDSRLRPFHRFFDIVDALRNTLGRLVDLVKFGAVRNPYLRAAINKSRELDYESCSSLPAGGRHAGGRRYSELQQRHEHATSLYDHVAPKPCGTMP